MGYRGKSLRIHMDTVGYLGIPLGYGGIPWGVGGIPYVAHCGKSLRYTPWDTVVSL